MTNYTRAFFFPPLVCEVQRFGREGSFTSYKGLAFFTKSNTPLDLPAGAEVVTADRIWIP
jgi:hypothetical protein